MSKNNFYWFREELNSLRTVIASKSYGLFYNSKSPKESCRHIAEYEPYRKPPKETLCGDRYANFSGTCQFDGLCNDCLVILNYIYRNSIG